MTWRVEQHSQFELKRRDVTTGFKALARFENLAALYRCADEVIIADSDWRTAQAGKIYEGCSSRREGGSGFAGTANYSEAAELAAHGWKEGQELVEQAKRQIDELLTEYRRTVEVAKLRPRLRQAGQQVHMGRFVTGHPECMLQYRKEAIRQTTDKVITLPVCIGHSHRISAAQIVNRGAAIAACIDLLEAVGYSCEVIAFSFFTPVRRGDGVKAGFTCPVKAAGQALDMPQLAYALAHASFLRRQGLAIVERFPDDICKQFGFHNDKAYAYPVNPDSALLEAAGLPTNRIDAFVQPIHRDEYQTPEAAADAVKQTIKKFLQQAEAAA